MARMLGILISAILIWIASVNADPTVSPTQGFTEVVLNATNFMIQKPYDKEEYERYSFIDGVHSMWVYKDDKPHTPESKTRPRTEIRIEGYDYTEGVWQFEGEVYVPHGTSGVCVMQVFGGVQHATSFMLLASNGVLMRYNDQVVASEIYDRWIHLNIIHNADEGKVSVFVDGNEKVLADDRGRANHYFKCGAYAGVNASSCMESRWRNIKLWTK
ncbi:hypothetical protein SUGI_1021760 [Cryptomeria japonica]|uniref:citrate-binding protein-like n=1 Tax=Cryptomeria japonica TaxID=3369 RepID=UPI0024149F91|nr:citrate-binding protein-like [Cryptomeria japonica]GLJ48406.1 hypothetical protein SUGI_1021760 [Cryptomeria japonica]